MNKIKINFIIDALMLFCMSLMAGIGFLMNYVLLSGRKAAEVYGGKVDLYFLGLHRHDWGQIHLVIGFILLGLLALHIILHWSQILNMYCRLIKNPNSRKRLAVVFIIIILLPLILFLFIKPCVQTGKGGSGFGKHMYYNK